MELLRFVCKFMSSNPFIVCSEELSYVKKQLLRDGDELKVKQKAGTVRYVARQGRYLLTLITTMLSPSSSLSPLLPLSFLMHSSFFLPSQFVAPCAYYSLIIINAGTLLILHYQCHTSIQ